MKRLSYRSGVGVLGVLAAVVAFQASPSATHAWRKYHWARTSNPFNVNLGRNVSSSWLTYLTAASSDWSDARNTALYTTVVGGGTTGLPCSPTFGRVEVCNAAYGDTGWLGVAQIWITRGTHIAQGTVKVNDTYFSQGSSYDTASWRQMVMCQEIGHTFGLNHQDTNFNNVNLGTCMDYTSNPDGPPSNVHPNQHDYDELAIIYGHLDSFSTVSNAKTSAAPNGLNDPSEWGQLMKTSHGGKTQIFEREFANGDRVVTFVIWA